jgi:FkbM family methyltransferase
MLFGKIIHSITLRVARFLPFNQAIFISRTLLEAQGFGSGAQVQSSGEVAVLNLITGPAPVLFDVGGHVGDYTDSFLRAHPGGHAFVFEPSDDHFRVLKERLGNRDNVDLIKTALSAQPGEFPLYKNAEMSGLASLTKRRLDHVNITMDKVEIVKVHTIDEVLMEHNIASIDLLKIDVEGHELDVLKGASHAFRDNRIKLVQFEFGGCDLDTRTSLQDFFYFFKQYGFTIGIIQPSSTVHWLPKYDEFFEQYRTTNYLAFNML